MCTFQGETYLDEQLESIAAQTQPPHELVVCDDRSSDGTVEMVKDFRSQVSFPVRLYINEEQLGYTKNFERAIALCKGDLIFLADQDDIWNPEKLSLLTGFFDSPEIGAVFTDGEVVDEDLAPRGYGLWEANGFDAALQKKFSTRAGALDLLLKGYVVSGMTMGFRTSFRDLVLPIPPRWFHDAWIAALIAAVARVAMFRNPLVKYRQHQGQAIGVENAWGLKKKKGLRGSVTDKRRTKTGAEGFRRLANTCAEVQDRLRARTAQFPGAAEAVDDLEARIRHICARAAMRNGKGRFRLIAREALSLNYQKYSTGWKSIAADAFLL